jgi:hypothetical protein
MQTHPAPSFEGRQDTGVVPGAFTRAGVEACIDVGPTRPAGA